MRFEDINRGDIFIDVDDERKIYAVINKNLINKSLVVEVSKPNSPGNPFCVTFRHYHLYDLNADNPIFLKRGYEHKAKP